MSIARLLINWEDVDLDTTKVYSPYVFEIVPTVNIWFKGIGYMYIVDLSKMQKKVQKEIIKKLSLPIQILVAQIGV